MLSLHNLDQDKIVELSLEQIEQKQTTAAKILTYLSALDKQLTEASKVANTNKERSIAKAQITVLHFAIALLNKSLAKKSASY